MRNARPILPWNVSRTPTGKAVDSFRDGGWTLLGSGLKTVEKAVQNFDLKLCTGGGPAFRPTLKGPHCRHLVITFVQANRDRRGRMNTRNVNEVLAARKSNGQQAA